VRLLLLGGVILRILRKVTVGTRLGDLLDDAGALDLLAVFELGGQNGIPCSGHRYLVHRSLILDPPAKKTPTAAQISIRKRDLLGFLANLGALAPVPVRAQLTK
jgi:hypothetical protein